MIQRVSGPSGVWNVRIGGTAPGAVRPCCLLREGPPGEVQSRLQPEPPLALDSHHGAKLDWRGTPQVSAQSRNDLRRRGGPKNSEQWALESEPEMRILVFPLLPLLIACGGDRFGGPPRGQHPAPGTSIVRFAQVDDGVYRGSTPKSNADFRFLKSKHIRYVLSLEFIPLLSEFEERKAKKYGISLMHATMNGSPIQPSEKHVNHILLILRDKRFHPIYLHCALGRDRTSLIAALYKMYFHSMSRQAAWREMKSFGFKDSWTLRGLRSYFEEHSNRPRSL